MKTCAPCQLKHKLISKDHKWSSGICSVCNQESNVTEVKEDKDES